MFIVTIENDGYVLSESLFLSFVYTWADLRNNNISLYRNAVAVGKDSYTLSDEYSPMYWGYYSDMASRKDEAIGMFLEYEGSLLRIVAASGEDFTCVRMLAKAGTVVTEIHGDYEKLKSGKVVKGINSIDSFSFSMLMSNPGFNQVHDFTTLVKVYNTNRDRYEFFGRVLYSDTTMSDTGLITKEVTCESYFGFFCDSQQDVVGTKNWTVRGLLQHIIDTHNAQLEPYKQFTIGEVTVTDPNDNLYIGIQYANTWDTLKEKLIDKLGGELRFRVENGVNYVDYLKEIGKTSTTEIALSHNMKSIKQEKDPSAYITRLIPLGMKMGENDERMTIAEVNGGKNYIDDEYGIEQYGLHVGYHEWDDVTEPANLLSKGRAWLEENNKLHIKYSITALDLSLLGLDMDDFDVCNYHPIKNALIGVDDVARIIKKSIDVCEEVKSTIEVGDNFLTASDIQVSQQQESKKVYSKITKTDEEIRLFVTNEIKGVETSFTQTAEGIDARVQGVEDAYMEMALTLDGFTVTDSSGTTRIKGSSIDTTTLNVQNINLSGAISFSDLSDYDDVQAEIETALGYADEALSAAESAESAFSALTYTYGGRTYIDEDYLRTSRVIAGNLQGGTVDLINADEDTVGYITIGDASSADYRIELVATEGALFLKSGEGAVWLETNYNSLGLSLDGITVDDNFYPQADGVYDLGDGDFRWSNIYAETDEINTSDRNEKHDIRYDMERFEVFFDGLMPAVFKFNNGTSNRDHVGLVAQDVEDNLTACDLTGTDFAGFVKFEKKDGSYGYGLRYGEFIGLLIDQVQKLKARVASLEGK